METTQVQIPDPQSYSTKTKYFVIGQTTGWVRGDWDTLDKARYNAHVLSMEKDEAVKIYSQTTTVNYEFVDGVERLDALRQI